MTRSSLVPTRFKHATSVIALAVAGITGNVALRFIEQQPERDLGLLKGLLLAMGGLLILLTGALLIGVMLEILIEWSRRREKVALPDGRDHVSSRPPI